ncbi:MAG: hypothetical protein K9M45_03515 [Kiritimatiellales bacterium]|nr:hypothetical protein [Kiritimatiellales bacterium]
MTAGATAKYASFAELIDSISRPPPQTPLASDEAERLRYCTSQAAVQARQAEVAEKARLVDPGDKNNGKQSLRVVLARLAADPADEKAWENIVTVAPFAGKSAHFTKILLAHLYGRFQNEFPPPVLDAMRTQAAAYPEYLGGGTENHIAMQRVSATIFGAAYPDMKTCYGISGKELEALGAQWVQNYGRTVFHTSMKEYLSLIYLGVHNEIWLTAAEYAPTESLRLMSLAMLDWIWTDLAINSHLGQVLPPATRAKTMLDRAAQTTYPNTHAQWLAWLYWGDLHSRSGSDELAPAGRAISPGASIKDMMRDNEGFQTAIVPSCSKTLPNEIIRNIGAKNIALPYMLLQSRPHGNMIGALAANAFLKQKERGGEQILRNHLRSVYVARNYAMSGGYFRLDESGDNEPVKHVFPSALVYRSTDTLNGIIVSHPYWYAGSPHGNEEEAASVFGLDCWLGKSPFEQLVHWENTVIYLYDIPDSDPYVEQEKAEAAGKWTSARLEKPLQNVCIYVPESIDETRQTDWGWFLREGDVYIAVRPAGARRAEWQHCTNEVQAGYKRLVLEGSPLGLILEAGDAREYGTANAFIEKVGAAKLNVSKLTGQKEIQYVSSRHIPFRLRYNNQSGFPDAWVEGVKLDFEQWPICASPYVTSRDGVLNVNDGLRGFTIDWHADYPSYRYYDK